MENYFFFCEALSSRKVTGGTTGDYGGCLSGFVQQAFDSYDANLSRYLTWHFEKEFEKVHTFFGRVELLAHTRGAADVQIHESKANLQALVSAHSEKILQKGLKVSE